MSDKMKKKIRESTRIAMNRPEIIKKVSKTQFKKGQTHIFTEERNRKLSARIMGHSVSKETREKLRLANLGKKYPPRSESFRKKVSDRMKGNTYWKNGRGTKKFDTKCEKMLEWALGKLGFLYEKQVYLCGVTWADFYLPQYRIVVYADGDYWHTRPEIIERDARINATLKFHGFAVYRFWASEIEKSPMECAKRIVIPVK